MPTFPFVQGLDSQVAELQEQLAAMQKKLAAASEQAQSESAELHAKEEKMRARITELQAVGVVCDAPANYAHTPRPSSPPCVRSASSMDLFLRLCRGLRCHCVSQAVLRVPPMPYSYMCGQQEAERKLVEAAGDWSSTAQATERDWSRRLQEVELHWEKRLRDGCGPD